MTPGEEVVAELQPEIGALEMGSAGWDILQDHVGKLLVALCAGLYAAGRWLVGRQVANYDEFRSDIEKRVRALEQTVATKGDVTAVYDRINQLGNSVNAGLEENREQVNTLFGDLLKAALNRKD